MIRLLVGTMFAGKSTELIRVYKLHSYRPRACFVPALEGSRQENCIDARGEKLYACTVPKSDELTVELPSDGDIFIDEAQFFSEAFVDRIAEHQALHPSCDFYIAALSLDSEARPWPTTAKLACVADEVIRFHSQCAKCGCDAIYSACVIERSPFRESTFEPRCRSCYYKLKTHEEKTQC